MLLCPQWVGWLLGVHVGHEVHPPVAVAVFIVIQGKELYKVVIESKASPASKMKSGSHCSVCRRQPCPQCSLDAHYQALGYLLLYLLDVIIFGSFLQATCQRNNGHIGVKNTEGHVSELPFKLWDDLVHSLGSISGSRDDVLSSPMAIIPQLPREAIHSLLGGSDDMDYGHESFHNAKDGVDDLDQKS